MPKLGKNVARTYGQIRSRLRKSWKTTEARRDEVRDAAGLREDLRLRLRVEVGDEGLHLLQPDAHDLFLATRSRLSLAGLFILGIYDSRWEDGGESEPPVTQDHEMELRIYICTCAKRCAARSAYGSLRISSHPDAVGEPSSQGHLHTLSESKLEFCAKGALLGRNSFALFF